MDIFSIKSTTFAFLPGVGATELIVVFLVILLLFGSRKLPELAKGMGKAINEFKRASSEIEEDIKESIEQKPAQPSASVEKTQTPESASSHSH